MFPEKIPKPMGNKSGIHTRQCSWKAGVRAPRCNHWLGASPSPPCSRTKDSDPVPQSAAGCRILPEVVPCQRGSTLPRTHAICCQTPKNTFGYLVTDFHQTELHYHYYSLPKATATHEAPRRHVRSVEARSANLEPVSHVRWFITLAENTKTGKRLSFFPGLNCKIFAD